MNHEKIPHIDSLGKSKLMMSHELKQKFDDGKRFTDGNIAGQSVSPVTKDLLLGSVLGYKTGTGDSPHVLCPVLIDRL